MRIDRQQWPRLSKLLDVALDMDAGDRDVWLSNLPPEDQALGPQLRALLTQLEGASDAGCLKPPDLVAALDSADFPTHSIDGLASGMEIGAYRLIREIGRGGMGCVWLAERIDGRLKRRVALKFPFAGVRRRQLAERMARERDILAGLEHPNIARLYDADVDARGQPFLVLEYVEGVPLLDYCAQHGLDLSARLAIFKQVLSAVQYAHTRLVIHRDIKPSNVLVRSDGVAQLLDFGIAKLVPDAELHESALTQFGVRVLTPGYSSPEQITGDAITTSCDIYSLGVVLFELLTGSRPYRLKRESAGSLEDAVADADVVPPSKVEIAEESASARASSLVQLRRQLRGDLDTIVLKALRKDPAERYASADALARDIDRALNGEPVEARPQSRWYVFQKLLARNKLATGAVGAVILVLALGVAATSWQAEIARENERRAVAAAATSDAVKNFMIRIFETNTLAQDDPMRARQRNALELLEEGADRVHVEFKDNPGLQRELLTVITRLLAESRSGEFSKHALALMKLLEQTSGTELQRAELYNELAMTAPEGDPQLAERYVAEGLALLGDRSDAPHRKARGLLLTTRGNMLTRKSEFAASVEPFTQARDLLADGFADTTYYGNVLSSLGWIEIRFDRYDSALSYFEQAAEATRRDPTAFPRTLAMRYDDLASAKTLVKRYADAERNFRMAIDVLERSYGRDDPETAVTILKLGRALAMQTRYDEAIASLREAVQILEKPHPHSNASYLANARDFLVVTLLQAGRLDEAEPLVRRLVESPVSAPAFDQANMHVVAAEYFAQRGDLASAQKHARAFLDAAQAAYGEGNPKLIRFRNRWARLLLVLGQAEQASQLAIANMKADAANEGVFDSIWRGAHLTHKQALVFLGRGAQAVPSLERLLEQHYAQPKEQQDPVQEHAIELELGRALMAAGRQTEALPHLERALGLRQSQYRFSPQLAEAKIALADCKLRLGDVNGSRALLAEAEAIHAANRALAAYYRAPLRNLQQRLRQFPRAPT